MWKLKHHPVSFFVCIKYFNVLIQYMLKLMNQWFGRSLHPIIHQSLCVQQRDKNPQPITHSVICRSEKKLFSVCIPNNRCCERRHSLQEILKLFGDGFMLPSKRLAASWRGSLKKNWQAILHKWLAITVQIESEKWTNISKQSSCQSCYIVYVIFTLFQYTPSN